MPEINEKSTVARAPRVAQREIDGEVLLVPVRSSPDQELGIFTLNATAGFIWQVLRVPRSIETLVEALCTRYEVEATVARADVLRVCQELLDAGVLVLAPEDGAPLP